MRRLNLSIKALIFCWVLTIFKHQFGAGPIASLRRRGLKKILVLMMLCLSLLFAVLSAKAEELSKNPETKTTKLDVDEILGRDPTSQSGDQSFLILGVRQLTRSDVHDDAALFRFRRGRVRQIRIN